MSQQNPLPPGHNPGWHVPPNQQPPAYNPGWQQPVYPPPSGYHQPAPVQPAAAPYVIPPRPFNHGAHFIADIFTVGFWIPFHIILWAVHSRKSTVVMPDGRRVKR